MAQQANEAERDLIQAAERGELVVVRKLFAEGARLNARDMRGRTALLAATQRNEVEVARFLIREGADVNAKDFVQDTPYLYAAAEGRTEILKMALAAGADLKDVNRYRGTGLIPAAHQGPCRGGEATARERRSTRTTSTIWAGRRCSRPSSSAMAGNTTPRSCGSWSKPAPTSTSPIATASRRSPMPSDAVMPKWRAS